MKRFHIVGKRWFQRTCGNTYHSVKIYVIEETKLMREIAYIPFEYGYGDGFLQTAIDWLKANGHAPADAKGNTLYLREVLDSTYDVIDVQRKKDL